MAEPSQSARPPEGDESPEGDAEAGGDTKKKRSRQNFTWGQLSVLEQVFEAEPLPRQALLQELSNRLNITPRCAQVWFQNRRQKFKAMHQAMGQEPPSLKKTSSSLTTSLETLLPATYRPKPRANDESQLLKAAEAARVSQVCAWAESPRASRRRVLIASMSCVARR